MNKSLILLFFFCVSCSLLTERRTFSKKIKTSITAQFVTQEKKWNITYELSKDIAALVFVRNCRGQCNIRERNWTLKSPNLAIKNIGGHETIYSKSKKPFKRIVLEFSLDGMNHSRVYRPDRIFTDGGHIMFAGYLSAVPVAYDNKWQKLPRWWGNQNIDNFPKIKMKYLSDENLVVDGKLYKDGEALWEGDITEGIYVYSGKTTPVSGKKFTAVIDPGLPTWLKKYFCKYIPKFVNHYEKKLGVSLERPVQLFIDFNPNFLYHYMGTAPGLQAQFSISGEVWEEENRESRERALILLAHEIFHLFDPNEMTSKTVWLGEGAAAFFDEYTLLTLGLMSSERYQAIRNENLNRCLLGVRKAAVVSSIEKGHFENYYECGAIINFLVEASLTKRADYNIYSFWGEIFRNKKLEKKVGYSDEMYLQLLEKISGDAELADGIKSLLYDKIENRTEFFRKLLKEVNVKTTVKEKNYSQHYKQEMTREALSILMQEDCGYQKVFFNKSHVHLAVDKECKNFKRITPITTVGGFQVYRHGEKIYDYLYSKCQENKMIEIDRWNYLPVSKMSFRCSYQFPARDKPLEIWL